MMEFYITTKKDQILIHATVWKNLIDTVLSRRSQAQKSRDGMIPFILSPKIHKMNQSRWKSGDCLGKGWFLGQCQEETLWGARNILYLEQRWCGVECIPMLKKLLKCRLRIHTHYALCFMCIYILPMKENYLKYSFLLISLLCLCKSVYWEKTLKLAISKVCNF